MTVDPHENLQVLLMDTSHKVVGTNMISLFLLPQGQQVDFWLRIDPNGAELRLALLAEDFGLGKTASVSSKATQANQEGDAFMQMLSKAQQPQQMGDQQKKMMQQQQQQAAEQAFVNALLNSIEQEKRQEELQKQQQQQQQFKVRTPVQSQEKHSAEEEAFANALIQALQQQQQQQQQGEKGGKQPRIVFIPKPHPQQQQSNVEEGEPSFKHEAGKARSPMTEQQEHAALQQLLQQLAAAQQGEGDEQEQQEQQQQQQLVPVMMRGPDGSRKMLLVPADKVKQLHAGEGPQRIRFIPAEHNEEEGEEAEPRIIHFGGKPQQSQFSPNQQQQEESESGPSDEEIRALEKMIKGENPEQEEPEHEVPIRRYPAQYPHPIHPMEAHYHSPPPFPIPMNHGPARGPRVIPASMLPYLLLGRRPNQ
jgi:uncharacterized protein YejL (UPF0352 family)